MKPIPQVLQNDKNRELLAFLAPLSCHSDTVEQLEKALGQFPDCKRFSPDETDFRYCLWYLHDVVFAFAIGMQKVYLLISDSDFAIASVQVEKEYEFDGNSWYSFAYDNEHLERVVKLSYETAKDR